MFAVVQYALTDVRPFLEGETARTPSPSWPVLLFPERPEQTPFVRGFGRVAPRPKGGLEEWAAEETYCDVSHALRLKQAFLQDHALRRSRQCRTYCALRRLYWDGRLAPRGSVVGRVEVGFGIKPNQDQALALEPHHLDDLLTALLGQQVYLLSRRGAAAPGSNAAAAGDNYFKLLAAGERLTAAYLRATTLARQMALAEANSWWVSSSSPMVILECGSGDLAAALPRAQALPMPQLAATQLQLFLYKLPVDGRLRPVWIIRHDKADRDLLRRLRINLSRLHAEISSLKVVTDLIRRRRIDPGAGSAANADLQTFLGQTLPFLTRESYNGLPHSDFLAAALTVIDAPLPGELSTLRTLVTTLRPNLQTQIGRLTAKMDQAAQRWDFFIAHAGADVAAAERLYDKLAPFGKVFLDRRSLLPGDNWMRALPEAQADSLITVVLISQNTGRAYYESSEIARAIEMSRSESERHRVVPIYLAAAGQMPPKPYGLEVLHALTIGDDAGYDEAVAQLRAVLQQVKTIVY
jgi:hypothetical protein